MLRTNRLNETHLEPVEAIKAQPFARRVSLDEALSLFCGFVRDLAQAGEVEGVLWRELGGRQVRLHLHLLVVRVGDRVRVQIDRYHNVHPQTQP